MRAFTLKSEIVSVDKSSKAINTVTKSYDKMAKTITRETKIANTTFTRFSKNVSTRAKRLQVGLNNVNASINKTFRKIGSSKLALGFGVGLLAILGSITKANIELDASIASLQAITGKTGPDFIQFRQEIDAISKSQKMFAGDTAKAFEIVGSAQPILLGNAKALAEVTNAAVTLGKAGLMPIEDSSKAVTGTMNQFELSSEHAGRVINVLAAGAKEGSANIRELSESMDKVGAVAKSANLSVEQTAAAVELMSKFNLKGSEAGISLKSTILRLKAASLGFASGQFNLNDALIEYNQQINAIQDPIKRAAKEEKVFGKVHLLTGKILTENIGELDRLTAAMTGTTEATIQANINNNTFKNRLAEISAAWRNSITATEDQGKQLQFLKDIMAKVADNMDRIVATLIVAVKIFLAYKAIVIGVNIVTKAYNILVGLQAGLIGRASIALKGNIVAMTAMNIATKAVVLATKAWVAVQWAINVAMTANPIGVIIVGIGLLIAGIVLLVRNWDKVKRAMIKVWKVIDKNPILKVIFFQFRMVVKAIKLIIKNFGAIKQSVKEVFESIQRFGQSVVAFFSAVGRFISVAFQIAVDKVIGFITGLWDKFIDLGIAAKELGAKLLAPFKEMIIVLKNIGEAIQTYIIDKFQEISVFIVGIVDKMSEFFGGAANKLDAKTEKLIEVYGLDKPETAEEKAVKVEMVKSRDSEKMATAINKNTEALDKNTSAGFGDWKGRFTTSILRDANISDRTTGVTQREIASSAINNENNIINTQNEVIASRAPQAVITQNSPPAKRGRSTDKSLTINVVDKTGGRFGIQVEESTGVEVITTGNG